MITKEQKEKLLDLFKNVQKTVTDGSYFEGGLDIVGEIYKEDISWIEKKSNKLYGKYKKAKKELLDYLDSITEGE